MKKRFLVLLVMALLVAPVSAMATSTLSFNDSVMGWIDVAAWDWSPGNALAVNAVPLSSDMNNPSAFDLYYQASLGNFLDVNGDAIGGLGLNSAYEITVVAGFSELGYRTDTGTVLSNANFSLAPNGTVNFFNVYLDNNPATKSSNLSGLGYADGVVLMSGTVNSSTGTFRVDVDANQDGILDTVPLDNFGDDNYPGILTLKGTGAADISAIIDDSAINAAYIDAGALNFYLEMLFNSSTITPFSQQNPSASVAGITPNIGVINGFSGPDFLFQADGNTAFTVVPEPSTVILLGLGLLGVGGLGILRRKQ